MTSGQEPGAVERERTGANAAPRPPDGRLGAVPAPAEARPGDPQSAPAGRSLGRWLVAEFAVLALAGLISLLLAVRPGYPADIEHYKYWTRLVTLGGIESAYSGTWPETYAVYPPVTLYLYKAVGHVYQTLRDPAFELERALRSQGLTTAIKLVAVGFHLLTGLALFLLVRRWASEPLALLASAAYALNPAAIYDVAGWGQPDSVHALFATVAVGLIALGWPGWAGVSLGLALLAKPQAWAVLPVAAVALLRYGPRATLRAGVAAAGTGLLVVAPFIVTGRVDELLTLPGEIAGVMPVATANAHNLWWIVTRGVDYPFVPEYARLIGPFTYRDVAQPLVGAAAAFAVWRLGPARPAWRLPLAAAYLAFAWFVLTTQAHENHAFFVLPLLALVLHHHASLRVAFFVVTVTLLANLFLHDPLQWELIKETIGEEGRWWLSQGSALLNVLLLAWWSWWLIRLTRSRAQPRAPSPVGATAPGGERAGGRV